EIGDGASQPLREGVEHLPQPAQVGFLSEGIQEAGDVPAVRDVVLAVKVKQVAQRGIAVQFGHTGLEADVAADDGKQDDAPENSNGIVVASVAACLAKAI